MRINYFFVLLIRLRYKHCVSGWKDYTRTIDMFLTKFYSLENWQELLLKAMKEAQEFGTVQKDKFTKIIQHAPISTTVTRAFEDAFKNNIISKKTRKEFQIDDNLKSFSEREIFNQTGSNKLHLDAIVTILTTYYIILIDRELFWFRKVISKKLHDRLIIDPMTGEEFRDAEIFFTILIHAAKHKIIGYVETRDKRLDPNFYMRILGYLYRGFIYFIEGKIERSVNDLLKSEQQILRVFNSFYYPEEYFKHHGPYKDPQDLEKLSKLQVLEIRKNSNHYSFLQIYFILCNIGLGHNFQIKGQQSRAFDYYCKAMRELKYMRFISRGNPVDISSKWRSSYLLIIEATIQKANLFFEQGLMRHSISWFFISLISILNLIHDFLKTNVEARETIKQQKERVNLIIYYLETDVKHHSLIDKQRLIFVINHVLPCNLHYVLDKNIDDLKKKFGENGTEVIRYFMSEIFSMLGFIFFTLKLDYFGKTTTTCQSNCYYKEKSCPTLAINLEIVYRWLWWAHKLCEKNKTVRYHTILFNLRHSANLGWIEKLSIDYDVDTIGDDFIINVLKKLHLIPKDGKEYTLERDLLISLLLNRENFITLPRKIFSNLLPLEKESETSVKLLKPPKPEDVFLVLRRWSSFTPRIPGAHFYNPKGGGYFFIWKGKGVAIDPGYDFLENLYQEGYSLKDIHAVVITHSHADHSNDFQPILDLLYEMNRLRRKIQGEEKYHGIHAYLNKGAYSAFSALLTSMELTAIQKDKIILGLHCLEADSFLPVSDFNMAIETVDAPHFEMIGEHCVGLIFHLMDPGKPWNKKSLCGLDCEPEFIIGITSDTRYYEKDTNHTHSICERYKKCDLLVAHLGNLQFTDMYNLIQEDGFRFSASEIYKIMKPFDPKNSKNQEDLRFFLYSLGCKLIEGKKAYVDLLCKEKDFDDFIEGKTTDYTKQLEDHFGGESEEVQKYKKRLFRKNHLGFFGVKRLFEALCKSMDGRKDFSKLMIISEFREEMRNYRNKIAYHLNEMAHKSPEKKAGCLTGDIGLRIFLRKDEQNEQPKFMIQCKRCAQNNDRNFNDTMYPFEQITEVCIKHEDNSIHYYCKEHDPIDPIKKDLPDPGERRNYKNFFIEKTS